MNYFFFFIKILVLENVFLKTQITESKIKSQEGSNDFVDLKPDPSKKVEFMGQKQKTQYFGDFSLYF